MPQSLFTRCFIFKKKASPRRTLKHTVRTSDLDKGESLFNLKCGGRGQGVERLRELKCGGFEVLLITHTSLGRKRGEGVCVRGNLGRRVERKGVKRRSEGGHGREMCVRAGVHERCSFTNDQSY